MSLQVIPVTLADANAFVERLHRHHKKVVGQRPALQPQLCREKAMDELIDKEMRAATEEGSR